MLATVKTKLTTKFNYGFFLADLPNTIFSELWILLRKYLLLLLYEDLMSFRKNVKTRRRFKNCAKNKYFHCQKSLLFLAENVVKKKLLKCSNFLLTDHFPEILACGHFRFKAQMWKKKDFEKLHYLHQRQKKTHFLKTNILFWSELFFLFLACTIRYMSTNENLPSYSLIVSTLLFHQIISSPHSFSVCKVWSKKKMHSPTVLST